MVDAGIAAQIPLHTYSSPPRADRWGVQSFSGRTAPPSAGGRTGGPDSTRGLRRRHRRRRQVTGAARHRRWPRASRRPNAGTPAAFVPRTSGRGGRRRAAGNRRRPARGMAHTPATPSTRRRPGRAVDGSPSRLPRISVERIVERIEHAVAVAVVGLLGAADGDEHAQVIALAAALDQTLCQPRARVVAPRRQPQGRRECADAREQLRVLPAHVEGLQRP